MYSRPLPSKKSENGRLRGVGGCIKAKNSLNGLYGLIEKPYTDYLETDPFDKLFNI